MAYVTTPSYRLATYEKGSSSAARCAFVLPGRLESKDYVHIRSHVDTLAELGYHAVAFDPPGSWESDGDITSYTITNYLGAVNELVAYYGNKPTVLVGHSLGGTVAILSAANNPQVTAFIALMTLAGGPRVHDTEWETEGKVTFHRDLPPGDHHTPEQKRYDLPYSFVEDALGYDSEAALKDCAKPKLFVVGTYDTQNVPAYIKQAYAAISEPKQLLEIASQHSYRYNKELIDQINTIIEQFVLSLDKP